MTEVKAITNQIPKDQQSADGHRGWCLAVSTSKLHPPHSPGLHVFIAQSAFHRRANQGSKSTHLPGVKRNGSEAVLDPALVFLFLLALLCGMPGEPLASFLVPILSLHQNTERAQHGDISPC